MSEAAVKIPPLKGVKEWRNKGNGFYVMEIHYTAEPEKATVAWFEKNRPLLPYNEWQREYEINWSSFMGKPVFANDWDPKRMVQHILPDPKAMILRSWDFGYHHPAVAWGQIINGIQLRILESDMGEDVDFRVYARRILNLSAMFFPGRRFLDCCDRSGAFKKPVEGSEEVSILCNEFGITPRYRYLFVVDSLTALRKVMNQNYKGQPGLIINDTDSNRTLISAMQGGYHFAEKKDNQAEKEVPVADGLFENAVDPVRYMNDNFMGLMSGSFEGEMEKMAFGDTDKPKEDVYL